MTCSSSGRMPVRVQLGELDRGDDGRQRVAELVAQRGKELILGAVRVLGRKPRRPLVFVALAVGRASRQALDEEGFMLVVGARWFLPELSAPRVTCRTAGAHRSANPPEPFAFWRR